jgi:hypothetical protein
VKTGNKLYVVAKLLLTVLTSSIPALTIQTVHAEPNEPPVSMEQQEKYQPYINDVIEQYSPYESAINGIIYLDDPRTADCAPAVSTPTSGIPKDDKDTPQTKTIKDIWTFLASQEGIKGQTIAAIMGNLYAESSYNPDSQYAGHYGLVQWGGGRLETLKGSFSQNHKGKKLIMAYSNREDDLGDWSSVGSQITYMWYELSGKYSPRWKQVFDKANSAATIEQATYIINNEYEISGNADEAKREKEAKRLFEAYKQYAKS